MPSDPIVLAFDTSAAHCAAALLCGDRIVSETHVPMTRGQAERLMPILEDMLSDQGLTWRDLTAIGVGIGPGNFTGVRISVSAARGLALALDIPAVGISVLEAQAHGITHPVMSVIPAPRGRIYAQHFGADPAQAPALILPGDIVDPPERCVGTQDPDVLGPMTACAPAVSPVVGIAHLAAARRGNAQRPAPLYLRSADAAPPRDAPPDILP